MADTLLRYQLPRTLKKKTVIQRLKWELQGAEFLVRNLRASRGFSSFSVEHHNGFTLSGLHPNQLREFCRLHQGLRDMQKLNFWRKMLYSARGESMVAVAVNQQNEMVGFEMFYFRTDEIPSWVIHDAFTGIVPSLRGQGLGTTIRRYSAFHLRRLGIKGISTQVPYDNLPSMKSLLNAGYVKTGESIDGQTHFMIMRF